MTDASFADGKSAEPGKQTKKRDRRTPEDEPNADTDKLGKRPRSRPQKPAGGSSGKRRAAESHAETRRADHYEEEAEKLIQELLM
jgi:hypothetical protein